MGIQTSDRFLKLLTAALGLEGKAVKKIVLEAEVRDFVRVYVQLFPGVDECDRVTEATRLIFVDVVTVAPNGTITATKG